MTDKDSEEPSAGAMVAPAVSNAKSDSLSDLGTSDTTPSQPPEKAKGKACGVCNNHEARYKCSRCQLPYCSVACATLHRATHPAVPDDVPATTIKAEPITISNGVVKRITGTLSATGYPGPFSILEGAEELQTLFIMYPRLRSQLCEIYTATLPPTDTSTAPEICEENSQSFAERGRGRAQSSRGQERGQEKEPWNADRGTQHGIDALRAAKEQYGKAGEGVRDFSELVLKLVSMEGEDIARLVQEEVAEENAKIIAQLLNGDAY